MTTAKRLAAYIVSLSAGYCVPLVALAAVEDGFKTDTLAFHTSSRAPAFQTDASQDDLEALRVRLWALTEHGGTEHCNVEGVTAPCADVVVFEQLD